MLQKGEPKALTAVSLAAVALVLAGLAVAVVHFHMPVKETYWALTPPVIAIALALITKEVYSSLFLGILTGAFLNAGFDLVGTLNQVFTGGIIKVLADKWNVGILIFLVILGMMVQLMNRAGGSAAFGRWASSHITTRKGAQLATMVLGCLIFIDDYFNCLTVGSVMRPVTDKHMVSRAKLAYLIDSTAAPICIIAPISSWAAAVSGFVKGENGINLFVQAIPFNFYALLTIGMMILLITLNVDYGPMALHERNAVKGDLFTTGITKEAQADASQTEETRGQVIDMLLPIVALIICCVIGMIYTGGYFEGTGFVESFANSDASVGLVLGSSVALLITVVFYLVRQVLPFASCMECLPEGFKQMVPAMLILSFAWSLKAMTDGLGAAKFVAGVVHELPALHHLPHRHRPGLRHGYLVGHLRHPHPHRRELLPGFGPYHDDHLHFGLHGRRCLRRSLLAHFRYDDHVVGRSPVRPSEPRDDAAAVRLDGGRCILLHVPRGGLFQECPRFPLLRHRPAVPRADGHAAAPAQDDLNCADVEYTKETKLC